MLLRLVCFWLREGSTCTEAWKQWFRWAVIARFQWDVILGEFLVPGREHLQRSLKTMVSASRDEARRGKAHPLHLMLTQACLRLQTKQKPVKRLRIILSMMLLCIVPGNFFSKNVSSETSSRFTASGKYPKLTRGEKWAPSVSFSTKEIWDPGLIAYHRRDDLKTPFFSGSCIGSSGKRH